MALLPGNDVSADEGFQTAKRNLESHGIKSQSASVSAKPLSSPLCSQDFQSLQLETKNLLRKCGTPTNLKSYRLPQGPQNKVDREKRDQLKCDFVIDSASCKSASFPRPPSADSIKGKERSTSRSMNLIPRKNRHQFSSSPFNSIILDSYCTTPPRNKYIDPQVYTETRRIPRNIKQSELENELLCVKQMDILRNFTSQEQCEENVERLHRRFLIKNEKDAALMIQKLVRSRPASKSSQKESEIRCPFQSRSNKSICSRTIASFKRLPTKADNRKTMNTYECLPSIYAHSSLKKATRKNLDDCKEQRRNSIQRRLFLEDGTPSDYLGSSVLNLCKSSRPKSASNKSDISKKEYDELSEERLTNDVKILPVLQNCIQSFSDTNSTEGHTYKLSCDVTSLNGILHRGYGKNSCDMETKAQTSCLSSQSRQVPQKVSDPVVPHNEPNDIMHKLELDGIVFRKDGEPGPLCRRYRSEVFQEECVIRKQHSDFYETHKKRFRSVWQQGHPIYRMIKEEMNAHNLRHNARRHVKYWFRSLTESLRCRLVEGLHPNNATSLARTKATMRNLRDVKLISKNIHRYIDTETLHLDMNEIRSKPISLYQPRVYLPSDAKIVVLSAMCDVVTDESVQQCSSFEGTQSLGKYESERGGKNENESNGPNVRQIACYASISQRPASNNMAVGGLSSEVIVSHFVSTNATLYGGFTCDEHALLPPETLSSVSKSADLFSSCKVPQTTTKMCTEHFFHSPIDAYLPFPIIVYSGIDAKEKHYGSAKRHQLCNVKEFFGFRTSEAAPSPILRTSIKICPALPSPGIVTTNSPIVEKAQTTHSDLAYPFCQPLSRKLTTKDCKSMLQRGEPSPNKTRTYTSVCSRHQGKFLRQCDSSASLGRLVSITYCTENLEREKPNQEKQNEKEERTNSEDLSLEKSKAARFQNEIEELPVQSPLFSELGGSPVHHTICVKSEIESVHDIEKKDELYKDGAEISSLPEIMNNSMIDASLPNHLLQTDIIVESITKALSGVLKDFTSPSDLLRVGVGLGISLGSQGLFTPASYETQKGSRNISGRSCMILDSSLPSVDAKERIATPPSHNENRKAVVPQLELPKDVGTPKHSKQESPNRQYQISSDFNAHCDETETASFAVSSTRVLRSIPSPQEKMLYSHYCIPAGKLEFIHMGNEWRLAGYNPWCSQDFFPMVEFETCFIEQDAAASEMEASETIIAKDFSEVIKLVKQGKYDEVEEKLCSHDWVVPVDYENAEGNTIFMICCQYGSKRIAKLLLKKGSSINKQNLNGHTCLHYAFGYGFGEYISGKSCSINAKLNFLILNTIPICDCVR
jgi:hypothetical protein